MADVYIVDKEFDAKAIALAPLEQGEYENCTFTNIDLSNQHLSGFCFIDCQFTNVNLSMAKLGATVLRDIRFTGCKMLGLRFDDCNQFGLSVGFDECHLDHSSFHKTSLKKTVFRKCSLKEVDFTDADFSASIFETCDFTDASFENTILEKADFRTSFNFGINPAINKVKKAKFSLQGLPGLLEKFDLDIHL